MKSILALCCLFSLLNCASSTYFKPIYEPIKDKISIQSPEKCLGRFLGMFSQRPCIQLTMDKDNTTGEIRSFVKYTYGILDLEIPLGMAFRIDEVYYLVKKINTDYSELTQVVGELPPEAVKAFLNSKKVSFSYSTKIKTSNFELSDSDLNAWKDDFQKMNTTLQKEGRMDIHREYFKK